MYILLMLVLFFSCITKNKEDGIVIGYDKDINEEDLSQLFFVDNIEVIPLKSNNEDVVLSNPEKIVLYDNYFYVMDNNKIHCYDHNGNFVRIIGKKGNGHGEYINLASFVVHNDTAWLFDSYKNALLAYSLTGDFMYGKKAPEGILSNLKDVVYETDNTFFIANYIFNEQNELYMRWNTENNEVSVVANAKVRTDGTKEFVGDHSFCRYNNNIRYVLPFSNIVMSTNDNAIKFLTSKKVLKDSDLRDISNFSIASYASRMDDFTGFCNIFETKDYLLLTFFNLEYTVVDKKSNECFRYDYQVNEDCDKFPLLNILSSEKDTFIGIVNTEDYRFLESQFKKYMKGNQDTVYNYAIIMYHTKSL